MKNKINKWHILLMSLITLFVTVCASLFSLRADPIDDETGEILTDNWELGIVFYDSTINNGNTPLTEINWDASDGEYKAGTPRVITVQINYKNNSAVTTYAPGELEIRIPNLIYNINSAAQLSASVLVGANDATHSGYDWSFNSNNAPSTSQETYSFINAMTIEEESNFEGSIQIQYTITPSAETPERFLEECIHNYKKTIQASLGKTGDKVTVETKYLNVEHIITSPNWPNNYNSNMKAPENTWEYTSPNLNTLVLYFDPSSITESNYDYVYIYNKSGILLYTLSGTTMAGKEYYVHDNYVKIIMTSDGSGQKKGFHLSITDGETETIKTVPEGIILSNELNFDYTRTYIHPWQKQKYSVSKSASKLSAYDGLPQGADDYIWVKYSLYTSGTPSPSYPYIGCKSSLYLTDPIPENCIAFYTDGSPVDIENNQIIIPYSKMSNSGGLSAYIYLGYPKEIYNENSNNLTITNTVNLYGTYENETEETFLDDGSVTLNLADFKFNYTGELYGLSKIGYTKQYMSSFASTSTDLMYQSIRDNDGNNYVQWQIYPSVYYTGTPLTVRIGDDLVFATNENGEYEKLDDSEYYYKYIYIPGIYNMNGQMIPAGKYDMKLFVRYAGTDEYVQYGNTFKNNTTSNTSYVYGTLGEYSIEFPDDVKVVSWYLQIDDMNEGIKTFRLKARMFFTKQDISESGNLYNLAYLKVFSKDTSGNLTLLNNVDESSYANFVTKEHVATHDLAAHNGYVQRAVYSIPWSYYKILDFKPTQSVYKEMYSSVTQDAENERFTGTFAISGNFSSTSFDGQPSEKIYLEQVTDEHYQSNMTLYDLLPEGMSLISTAEEIFNRLAVEGNYPYYYNKNKEAVFSTHSEMVEFFKNHTTITITENWKNTGRTLLKIEIDFPDCPLMFRSSQKISNTSAVSNMTLKVRARYDYAVSYDAYIEKGKVWQNYVYGQSTNTNISNLNSSSLKDNGTYDKDASDITENNSTEDKLLSHSATITINSIVSTHQDVTTYVKTDQNYYSTGTVDASCDSEYEYKLRVRTGAADVTNLILYTNIEEAQPERTRWKGEFLGINTTYANTKGYKINTYYSENPKAESLYNEDGSINSEWHPYYNESREAGYVNNSLAITFNSQSKTESTTYDYVEIYYKQNETIYSLGRLGGSDIAGKTIIIPTSDFYLYWKTDSSACSYYGFSIDSITPTEESNIIGTVSSLPPYTAQEVSGNTYPDSAFGSYTHENYGDNVNKLWHYTYTGQLGEYQEAVEATDKTKVKSLAFEYLDKSGNPAIVPANSITYILINMKSPSDESLRTLARMDCRTQWNALDEFGQPVDFITGINSNIVKVSLPNSIDEDSMPKISLRFIKEIQGTDADFENMKLDKAAQQTFMIRLTDLTANEDGSHNQVTALLKSNQELIISQIPVGTYLLEELGDNYFDFVEFTENNGEDIVINGVTFERTDQGYIITVSEDLMENVEFNIKVTNEIEQFRPYEDKENKENLFLKNKIEEDS